VCECECLTSTDRAKEKDWGESARTRSEGERASKRTCNKTHAEFAFARQRYAVQVLETLAPPCLALIVRPTFGLGKVQTHTNTNSVAFMLTHTYTHTHTHTQTHTHTCAYTHTHTHTHTHTVHTKTQGSKRVPQTDKHKKERQKLTAKTAMDNAAGAHFTTTIQNFTC